MNSPLRHGTAASRFGFSERFQIGDKARAEAAAYGMAACGAGLLRLPLIAADYESEEALEWLDWLVPHLAERFEILLSFELQADSTPLTESDRPTGSSQFSHFLDQGVLRYARHVGFVELIASRELAEDIGTAAASTALRDAIRRVRDAGLRPVFSGTPAEIRAFAEQGQLDLVAAVGLAGKPREDRRPSAGARREHEARLFQDLLSGHASHPEIWITDPSPSFEGSGEVEQLRAFREIASASAERFYWPTWQNGVGAHPGADGIITADDRPTLLGRLLKRGGVAEALRTAELTSPRLAKPVRPVTIMGGSGFVGCNLADSFLSEGREVLLVDNLSRPGVETNLEWLVERHGARVHPVVADVRDAATMGELLGDAGAVFHFAAQVAVTTSLDQPVDDFEINARGTLNVLEALRRAGSSTPIVFASTNKVYGGLDDLQMAEAIDRYHPADNAIHAHGIGEDRNLDFCTPYGCSKGVADQYVLDYAKSYGVPSAVLRMSCIYGPRQFGTEDQGWVAHFLIRALKGEPITIYGDGKQVRDVLHVRDAVAAYRAVLANIHSVKGQAFNLGGGPLNAVSLKMVLNEIGRLTGSPVDISYGDWRAGDQLYFVADTRKIERALGWRAEVEWRDGIADLYAWLAEQHDVVPAPSPLGNSMPLSGDQPRRLSA